MWIRSQPFPVLDDNTCLLTPVLYNLLYTIGAEGILENNPLAKTVTTEDKQQWFILRTLVWEKQLVKRRGE